MVTRKNNAWAERSEPLRLEPMLIHLLMLQMQLSLEQRVLVLPEQSICSSSLREFLRLER